MIVRLRKPGTARRTDEKGEAQARLCDRKEMSPHGSGGWVDVGEKQPSRGYGWDGREGIWKQCSSAEPELRSLRCLLWAPELRRWRAESMARVGVQVGEH